ncbi:ATP-binding cassette domain-containing protein, partial [Acidobacteria bacterium AH-259-A15]|nr:ATP-binding cassette domain-containing protein [Acidobacteria bacterium AH-259-A15]
VEFRQVSYRLSKREILSDLNLEVHQGETFVLLGRSGCGKTTTLKLVNRLIEPTSGEVRVEGRPTTSWDPISLRRRIGYVIQEVGLFPHFTVERNIALVPSLEKWETEKTRLRVKELLTLVGLDPAEFSQCYPSELSGGQRQRVGVARALAVNPPILLMDEPFGALDPLTRSEIQEEFKELQERLKKSILFVTHDLREALLLGDRIGLMKKGQIAVSGTPERLLSSSDPEIVVFMKPLQRMVSSAKR